MPASSYAAGAGLPFDAVLTAAAPAPADADAFAVEEVDASVDAALTAAAREGVGVSSGVPAAITDTEPDAQLVTYAVLPSGVTTTPYGFLPTAMVLVTLPVAVSITDTEPDPIPAATYTVLPSGVTTTPSGVAPTVMVSMTTESPEV